jgi:hypothetical protein
MFIFISSPSLSFSFLLSLFFTPKRKGREEKKRKNQEKNVTHGALRHSESRHGVLNYTRVRTGFTSGGDNGGGLRF